jgi:hypothetical protein
MTTRQELLTAFDGLLQPARFKDYGPNGLQVEGRSAVRHIVSGVTASLALIDAAIAEGADTIFVHHGLFWRGQDGCVTGWTRQRLARLLAHDINLFAYHLPLDAHPELGNNAQLGARLGLRVQGNFGEQMLGCWGDLEAPLSSVDALAQQLQSLCGDRGLDGLADKLRFFLPPKYLPGTPDDKDAKKAAERAALADRLQAAHRSNRGKSAAQAEKAAADEAAAAAEAAAEAEAEGSAAADTGAAARFVFRP